ncbi:MAG: pseudouridine synthase [Planctomycetota bacterium]|nr:pseudouridine synthase [Planctomycetota bacterium]
MKDRARRAGGKTGGGPARTPPGYAGAGERPAAGGQKSPGAARARPFAGAAPARIGKPGRAGKPDRAAKPGRTDAAAAAGERNDGGAEPGAPARETWLHGGIRVVHEDEDVLVVDKPAGLATVSPPGLRTPSVFDEIKGYVRDKVRRRGTRVWVIHRLDKEASGLLVFAKTEKAFHWLKEEFRAKRVHRLYAAVVEGEIESFVPGDTGGADAPAEEGTSAESGGARAKRRRAAQSPGGTIQSFLYEDERGVVRSVSSPGDAPRGAGVEDDDGGGGAKLAVTHWQAQRVGSGRSLLQVRLETGRKHQIRAHLASVGRVIVGDRRYGCTQDPLGRVCLHAFELGFARPRDGQTVRFVSPTPGSFFGLVGREARKSERAGRTGDGGAELVRSASEGVTAAAGGERTGQAASTAPKGDRSAPGPTATPDEGEARAGRSARESSWDHVASWYDQLLESRGSDHHEQVIVPGALRLLSPGPGSRVLDVACGQGVLCRALAGLGAQVVGVDASEKLVEAARRLGAGRGAGAGTPEPRYVVGDARELEAALGSDARETFDQACCVMALMNIDPLSPVAQGVAAMLRPGGAFVGVVLHPAFRAPGQTSWAWETGSGAGAGTGASGGGPEAGRAGQPVSLGGHQVRLTGAKFGVRGGGARVMTLGGRPVLGMRAPLGPARAGAPVRDGPRGAASFGVRARPAGAPVFRQFRRVDGYLTPGQKAIVMNPGAAAHGATAVTTVTYHRPVQSYVRAFADAGLLVESLEEWASLRVSQPGPRAAEENRARREIPMFLALRCVKVGRVDDRG